MLPYHHYWLHGCFADLLSLKSVRHGADDGRGQVKILYRHILGFRHFDESGCGWLWVLVMRYRNLRKIDEIDIHICVMLYSQYIIKGSRRIQPLGTLRFRKILINVTNMYTICINFNYELTVISIYNLPLSTFLQIVFIITPYLICYMTLKQWFQTCLLLLHKEQ